MRKALAASESLVLFKFFKMRSPRVQSTVKNNTDHDDLFRPQDQEGGPMTHVCTIGG